MPDHPGVVPSIFTLVQYTLHGACNPDTAKYSIQSGFHFFLADRIYNFISIRAQGKKSDEIGNIQLQL